MINTKNVEEKGIDDLLTKTTEFDIFKYYIGEEFCVGCNILSPLRKENNPSFQVFQAGNRLKWKDFGTGDSGDFIELVKKKFKITFYQALNRIYKDLKGIKAQAVPYYAFPGIQPKREIRVKKRKFNTKDLEYWTSYGINLKTLEKYEVSALSKYWLTEGNKEMSFNCHRSVPVYCYHYGNYSYRLYSPFSKDYKWICSAGSDIIQGWNQLPEKGEKLVITSSLKDVMLLDSLKYVACAPQSENTTVPAGTLISLMNRFKKIYAFMNNDEAGKSAGKRYEEKYDFKAVFLPEGPKDPSDYYKINGLNVTKLILKKLL